MKTLSRFAAALSLLAAFHTTSVAQLKETQCEAIKAYFSNRLSTVNVASYSESITLKSSKTQTAALQVWKAWKEANRELKADEKLIPLQQLDSSRVGQWHLPAALEPNAVMNYYYGKKSATDSKQPLPLYLYLHGSGPRQHEWATGLLLAQRFADSPSAYFIPQIPNEGKYYRWWQQSKQFAWERLLRQTLLDNEIDPNKVYVFGISEGGYGSQRLASFYADYWAAAGPMAGGEPLRNAPVENCSNIGFSFLTGADDKGFYRNILTHATQQYFDSMQMVRPELFRHRIELIPGRGHHIDYRPTTPWLRLFTRNPQPRHYYWENMEMDGRYRNGFYNLQVIERSNRDDSSRMFFMVDINDNNVDVRVSEVEYEITERDPNWGIEMAFSKHYKASGKCKFRIYLSNQLVDLSRKVTIVVNGKQVFKGKLKNDVKNIVNSCALFGDPCRLFTASVDVEI